MEWFSAQDRIKTRFNRWDSHGSGDLLRTDFEREADRIAEAFGAELSAPATVRLRGALARLFELCARQTGALLNGPITEAQFHKAAEDLIFEQGEAAFNRALRPVVEGVIGLCETNRITRAEFTCWLAALGVSQPNATEAFDRIDVGGHGTLSPEELLAAIREYHYGRLDVELISE